jgi:hypothetical protein
MPAIEQDRNRRRQKCVQEQDKNKQRPSREQSESGFLSEKDGISPSYEFYYAEEKTSTDFQHHPSRKVQREFIADRLSELQAAAPQFILKDNLRGRLWFGK